MNRSLMLRFVLMLVCFASIFAEGAFAQSWTSVGNETDVSELTILPNRHPLASIRQESESGPSASEAAEPGEESTAAETLPATPRRRRLGRRRSPKSHGHFFTFNTFQFTNSTYGFDGFSDYLVPGRFKVADNHSAVPEDRWIFHYQHFGNALTTSITDGAGCISCREFDVNYFNVGFEKTLDPCKRWSLEVILPIVATPNTVFSSQFSNLHGRAGNLSLVVKRILKQNECHVVSAGLGVSLPTGDDERFITGNDLFIVRNDALYLQPFISWLWQPDNCWYFQNSIAVDTVTRGNRIEYRRLVAPGTMGTYGRLNDQTLLHLDWVVGRWWFRESCHTGWTGFATNFELHYASTLQNGDMVVGGTPENSVRFAPYNNRFDVLDATLGCTFEFNRCHDVRFAWAVPLRGRANRFFDSEIQFSYSKRF